MTAKARDIMKVHHMLAHASEEITRKTAEAMGIVTTSQCGPREACLQAKAKRAVAKMADKRANMKRKRFYVNVDEPIKHSSLEGNKNVAIFVDDCTRF